jgi:hypothetical protein
MVFSFLSVSDDEQAKYLEADLTDKQNVTWE